MYKEEENTHREKDTTASNAGKIRAEEEKTLFVQSG